MDKPSVFAQRQDYESVPGGAFSEFGAASKPVPDSRLSDASLKHYSGETDVSFGDSRISRSLAITNRMQIAIREGSSIEDLIGASPEEVIAALRDHSVDELARFTVNESDALLAFGSHKILTRGFSTRKDEYCVENWKAVIATRAAAQERKRKMLRGSWDQQVTIVAYVVNIKNAAAGKNEGLLYPLVQKSLSGAATKDIWEFDAVQAVIEYKWRHWARRYLVAEFVLYLAWVISFSIFLVLYIEVKDINKEGGVSESSTSVGTAMVCSKLFDALACLFMLPFLLIDYNTALYYGRKWFQSWNLLDVTAYILQIIITLGNLTTHKMMDTAGYNTMLAVQCSILYIKVQYFSRFFGAGSSFAQLIVRVIKKVRGFLGFIVLTMISAALSVAVLYRQDIAHDDTSEAEKNMDGVLRSFVTMMALLFGEFDSGYISETSNVYVKGMYFVVFQVMMSITILNLLIAVMTESYSNVVKEERVMDNMGRAQVMDELEIALPTAFEPHLKPYCHFIVVEKEPRPEEVVGEGILSQISLPNDNSLVKEISELRSFVQELKASTDKNMEDLKSMVKALQKEART